MIVIDVGCAKYGGDESIPYLIEEFSPETLYGFDPACESSTYYVGDTLVVTQPWAAWTEDTKVGFDHAGLRGKVKKGGKETVAFDLSALVHKLSLTVPGANSEIVLKLDCEGAEYTLLPHLRDTDADLRLKLIWCEWHCEKCGTGWFSFNDRCGRCQNHDPGKRSELEGLMRCEMHQWNR
jgi:hypothetical protein